jgi:hypothetical protein
MARPPQPELLTAFKPIDGLTETTQLAGGSLTLKNILLRPVGGMKGPPRYERLWGIGSASTIYATLTALGLADSDNTVALRVARQGKNLLLFYNMPSRQCRGLFYMGDDGTYTSGSYDFTASSGLAWEILARDLDDTARWYGGRIFQALFLGNGVNDNVVAQLGRSATPGKWRKAASNIAPTAPVISLVTPATSTNVQAYVSFPRTSGKVLTFRARDTLFPGLSGNNKIRVRITQTGTGDSLISALSGQGTTADPYYYTLAAGTTSLNSSTDAIVSYVNADSQVLGILQASKDMADAAIDTATYGPADLENGTGTGTSAGYSNRTVTFYSRYWDPGAQSYGYEGVSSPISNELVIPSSANNDIRVLVPVDASAEGGRFGYIRLYMQFEEDSNAVWLLINPDDPVPNGLTGTFTRYASTSEITLSGSAWRQNDVIQLTTTGSLPGGYALATSYYLQPGTAVGRWSLSLTADGTAVAVSSAGSGVHTATLRQKCVQVGTQTPFLPADEGGEMFADQSRPLPHTLHAFTNDQVWRGGVTSYPERLYPSKPSTADEVAPEGVSLDDQAFVPVLNQSERGGTGKMTALVATAALAQVHYDTGITLFDPANTDQRNYTATGAGAINATCFTQMEGKGQFFLGKDLMLRRQTIEQTGAGFAATVASSEFTALAAVKHLRDRVNLAELARKPQRTFLFADAISQHLWMSLPGVDGSLKLFGYDLLNQGIVGELDYPQIYAACQMEPDRPEILFADESGNLFVYDPTAQQDSGDTLGTQTAFTTYATTDPVPTQYAGYGYVDAGGVRYYQSATSVLETGMINLSNPALRKALVGLLFRSVSGSRGIVSVTVTALNGTPQSLTLSQSQFYSHVEHRLNLLLGKTTAIKLKFEVLGAEQKGWIIRDIAALWTPAGRV